MPKGNIFEQLTNMLFLAGRQGFFFKSSTKTQDINNSSSLSESLLCVRNSEVFVAVCGINIAANCSGKTGVAQDSNKK